MVVSFCLGVVLAFGAGWPLWAVAGLLLLYGMAIYGDTGAITAGTVAAAVPEERGATLAVHATIGFLGGVAGPLAVGIALDLAGGAVSVFAWGIAFCVMASGSVFSAIILAHFKPGRADETA